MMKVVFKKMIMGNAVDIYNQCFFSLLSLEIPIRIHKMNRLIQEPRRLIIININNILN